MKIIKFLISGPVNDLKSSGFWITSHRKAKREQVDEEMMIIKLFRSNCARDLLSMIFP
jgi:hypothetical protein